MAHILDDIQAMRALDPEGTLDRINEMSMQVRSAWERLGSFTLPDSHKAATGIVICGLGGSAIGGDLARGLAQSTSRVPIVVHRGYGLPAWAGPGTLVIASSYSGSTEETLSAFMEGRARGCHLLALTTGGRLAQMALAHNAPMLDYQYRSQPRSALGFSLTLLLGVLSQMGAFSLKQADIDDACRILDDSVSIWGPEAPEEGNECKQAARALYGRLPIIYGADILAGVARRYKTQINENSKGWSFFEVLPELNHNAIVGYQFPAALRDQAVILCLTSRFNHPRNLQRMNVAREVMGQYGVQSLTFAARGDTSFGQVMSAVRFGDYISFYLAMLYGVDPTPIAAINFLKGRLASER